MPWLPVVAGRIVANREQSTRFLTDLRRTVADLVVSEHYDVLAEKARQHGLGMQAESGGPHGAPIDALETFRRAAVPQTEFWAQNQHRSADAERFFTKEAASAAHIYGQTLVAQEGETSVGPQWSESLATDLKPSFDMAVTEGMNRLFWHEFTSSPASSGLPGQEYFAGTHLNPKVTWWNAGSAFFDYLNRIQFLMQQGTQVDDVLYFYGDNVPNFVRLKADDPAHVLPGYDFDVTDEDALLRTLRVETGALTGPQGMTWRVLALPRTGRVSLPALERIALYAKAGGVVLGTPPSSPTGNVTARDEARFRSMVREMWGSQCVPGVAHAFGRGRVFCSQDAHAVLQAMQILPDALAVDAVPMARNASSTAPFDYVHRRIGAADVYFVRNGSAQPSSSQVLFRAQGRSPELWDPVTGTTEIVPAYKKLANGQVRVALDLAPFGSAVVFFAGDQKDVTQVALGPPAREDVSPSTSWQIEFQQGRGAPEGAMAVDRFTSWTDWVQPGVRYFSGTATYRAQVKAPAYKHGAQVFLCFSDVREIAQVRVNGKDAGTVWAQPYTLRVDGLLQPGVNRLEIEVTNLWPNRIIGDLQPGVTRPLTQSNIKAYKADSPLLPSGLIGPLHWEVREDRRFADH